MNQKSNIDQAYEIWCLYLSLLEDSAPDGLIQDHGYDTFQSRNDRILYSAVCSLLSGIPFKDNEFKIAQRNAENASLEERIRIKSESEFLAKLESAIQKEHYAL